jgi:hypothetical protein
MTTKAKLSAVATATRAVASLGAYGVKAAKFCLASLAASKAQEAALVGVNGLVVTMREAGVTKVGRNSKKNGCPIAIDFHAALVTGGIKATTANNYLTTFKQAVESGKPITEWNASRANEKAKGKGGAGKGKATLESLLLKAFNHAEFKDMCEAVQAEYDDAKGDMHVCIESWLTAMGAEIE